MPTTNISMHILDFRTNSTVGLDYDTGRLHPQVEFIIIGYRPDYELDLSPDGAGARVKKKTVAETIRITLGKAEAEALRDNMAKVIEHLTALQVVADAVGDALAVAKEEKSDPEQPNTEDKA